MKDVAGAEVYTLPIFAEHGELLRLKNSCAWTTHSVRRDVSTIHQWETEKYTNEGGNGQVQNVKVQMCENGHNKLP